MKSLRILALWLVAWIASPPCIAQAPSAFSFHIVAPTNDVAAGTPVRLEVTALDATGAVMPTLQGTATLGLRRTGPVGLVVSEIAADGRMIEVTNPGIYPVDVVDWELEIGFSDGINIEYVREKIRGPAVLDAGAWFRWTGDVERFGVFPDLTSLGPLLPAKYLPFRVTLRDSAGSAVDQVPLWGSGGYATLVPWTGLALTVPQDPSHSHQRVGDRNHFRSTDWITRAATFGQINPGLALPWMGAHLAVPASTNSITLQAGRWAGDARLPDTDGIYRWAVWDASGHVSMSVPFRVLPLPALDLEIPDAALHAVESKTGPIDEIWLRVPQAASIDRDVSVFVEPPGEFAAPTKVRLPAGQTSVHFAVTNLDDTVADGRARVTLRAELAGHRPASETLAQDDDESGVLRMVANPEFRENTGRIEKAGRVILPQALAHDVEVRLVSSNGNVIVPASVILPAGQVTIEFGAVIENDGLYNGPSPTVTLHASMQGWRPAEAVSAWMDDEQGGYSWTGASELREGTTNSVVLRLAAPRVTPTRFQLSARSPGLVFPPEVEIPAGSTEVAFPVIATDNTTPNDGLRIDFCASSTDLQVSCTWLQVLDDDAPPASIGIDLPDALWIGDTTPRRVTVWGSDGRVFRTNVLGEVRVEVQEPQGTVVALKLPVSFVNGEGEILLPLSTPRIGTSVQVSAAGLISPRRTVDFLEGGRVPGPWLQVDERMDAGTLLLLSEGAQGSGLGTHLVEFDPVRWQTNRTLTLAVAAHTFSVLNPGRIAWVCSATGTVQRVNLSDGTLQSWSIQSDAEPMRAYAAAGMDVSGDRVLVLTGRTPKGTAAEMDLTVLVKGQPLSRALHFKPSYSNPMAPFVLLPGRTSEEWFLGAEQGIHRFRVDAEGLVPDSLESTPALLGPGGRLGRIGDELVTGVGGRIGLDPWRTLAEYGGSEAEAVLEGGRALGRTSQPWHFGVFDGATRELRGSHALPLWPDAVGSIQWMRPWGESGVVGLWSDRSALVWQSPLLGNHAADLAVSGSAPVRISRNTSLGGPEILRFERLWTITNRGPDTAVAVSLKLSQGVTRGFDHLDAGTSVTVVEEVFASNFGEEVGTASLTAGTHDPQRADNTAIVRTDVLEPSWGTLRQLRVAPGILEVSADGLRLWAVAASSGPAVVGGPIEYTGRALLEIDPLTGRIERTLPTVGDPNAVEPGADGRSVYSAEGMKGLTRWTLGATPASTHWEFPGESPRELVAVPDRPDAMVVLTDRRALVWENGAALPNEISGLPDYVTAEFARGRLWVFHPFEGLRSYRVDATGLTPDGGPWFRGLAGQSPRFSVGPTHLFFDQEVFDLDTPGFTSVPIGNAEWAEPRGGAVYGMEGYVFRRTSVPGFQLEAEVRIPGFNASPSRFVRWGERGVAMLRHDGWLLIDEMPLVLQPGGADLAVSLESETPSSLPGPQTWSLTVTNRSDTAATQVVVTLEGIDGLDPRGWKEQGGLYHQGSLLWHLGSLAARTSITYRVQLTHPLGGYRLVASALGSGAVDSLSDNRVERSGEVQWPSGDLQTRFVQPVRVVDSGEPFVLQVTVTNASPAAVSHPRLELFFPARTEVITVAPGTRLPSFFSNEAKVDLEPLGPGSEVVVEVRLRVGSPSLGFIDARTFGDVQDSNPTNNMDLAVLVREMRTPEEQAAGLVIPETSQVTWKWSGSTNRLLGAFAGFPGLLELDPATLAFRRWIKLPRQAPLFAISPNGNRVWAGQGEDGLARIELETEGVPAITHFAIDPSVAAFAPWWMTVPGHEDVVVIHGRGIDGVERTRAYRDGQLLPVVYSPTEPRDETLSVSPDGKLFLTGPTRIEELALTDQGIERVREFPGLQGSSGAVSYVGSTIVFTTGRTFDPVSAALDRRLDDERWPYSITRGDAENRHLIRTYVASDVSGRQRLLVEAFTADSKDLKWRLRPDRDFATPRDLVGMGTNGTLLVDNHLQVIPSQTPGPESAPLTVSVQGPPTLPSTQATAFFQVTVTNHGAWIARNTWLDVEHGTEATPVEPGTAVRPGITRFDLGHLWGETNLTLQFNWNTTGAIALRFRVGSDTPDPVPADNASEWVIRIPEDPQLYLDSGPIAEGSGLVAYLTGPAPKEYAVPFRIVPGTASAEDFEALEGVWLFYTGWTQAQSFGINLDAIGELPETFRLEVLNPPLPVLLGAVDHVILDRTEPVPSVLRRTVPERDDGIIVAEVPARLSVAMPAAVELGYEILAGTATAGTDFVAVSGRIRFEPGELARTLRIPILGDREWEPNETILIRWLPEPGVAPVQDAVAITLQNDDPAPRPALEIVRRAGDRLGIEFQSVSGMVYRLETKNALNDAVWRVQLGTLTGTGGRIAFEVTGAESVRFLRVSANPQ